MSVATGALDLAARDRVLASLGLTEGSTAFMRQVHGRAVAVVDDKPAEKPEADALVTARPGLGLAVLVADCVPILLAGGGAVGAVHSGRLGTAADVVGAAVEALVEAGGGAPEEVTAVIGPAIGGCCYEVPEAVADEIAAIVPGTRSTTTWGTPSLDLPKGVEGQLAARGVTSVHREGGCTLCEADTWYSHRASGRDASHAVGRMAGFIVRDLQ
jgi:YfiH family protein